MEFNKELYLKACERLRKHNMQVATRSKIYKRLTGKNWAKRDNKK